MVESVNLYFWLPFSYLFILFYLFVGIGRFSKLSLNFLKVGFGGFVDLI